MSNQRNRSSRDVPRHVPSVTRNTSSRSNPARVTDLSNSRYSLSSRSSASSVDAMAPWATERNYYPSSDAPFANLSVNPMALSHVPYHLDPSWTSNMPFDLNNSYGRHVPTGISSTSPGAGFMSQDFPHGTSHLSMPAAWNHGYPSPPEDSFLKDLQDISPVEDMLSSDLDFSDEPAPESEYLGISKLQFYSGPLRSSAPRPIRSASERSNSTESSTGSRDRFSGDDQRDRGRNNPRNDPRYDVKPSKDGYYHCPYEGRQDISPPCKHKPTKQKCIYAKNLDSHLKPYACKYGATVEDCKDLRFSSNACLFRHEREMHGLHNHGMNPYLCEYPGCDRARVQNGFPRRWNQRDHMKRVHGWEGPEFPEEVHDRTYPDHSGRKKGSGSSQSSAMKRVSSRTSRSYQQDQRQNMSGSRSIAAQDLMFYQVSMDDVQFSPSYPSHSYGMQMHY